MVSSNDVTITEHGSSLRVQGLRVFELHPSEVAALRAHFAAEAERNAWEDAERFDSDEQVRLGARYEERMPEDVQKLVAAARVWAEMPNSLVSQLAAALEAAYSQKGTVDDPR